MIVCAKCDKELVSSGGGYTCKSCGYEAAEKDGIIDFLGGAEQAEGYNEQCFEVDYEKSGSCFWFEGRNHALLRLCRMRLAPGARMLEIGCGAGQTLEYLAKRGIRVEGADIYREALILAKKKYDARYFRADIRKLPFRDEYDAVGMFDVLEHVDNEALALKNARAALKKDGALAITVPALRQLWSRHDEALNHLRRYEAAGLRKLLSDNGFKVLKLTYMFFSLLPALYIERVALSPRRKASIKDDGYLEKELSLPRPVNSLFGTLSWAEAMLLPYVNMPLGSTIIAIAQKTRDKD